MTIEFNDGLMKITRTIEPTYSGRVMSAAEKAILKLLDGKQLRASHPITVLNPQEWFVATEVQIDEVDRITVRSPYTCWWNLSQLEVRDLDAMRLDWIAQQHLEDLSMSVVIDAPHDGEYFVCGDDNKPGYGKTFREAIDAARGAA